MVNCILYFQKVKFLSDSKQVKFNNRKDLAIEISSRETVLTDKEKVLRAAVYQGVYLYLVNGNQSLKSSNGDSERFKPMFLDSNIAIDYFQEETEIKYLVQVGIAP